MNEIRRRGKNENRVDKTKGKEGRGEGGKKNEKQKGKRKK